MYVTHPHQVISDAQFDQFIEDGFLILPEFIRGEELKELQAAQRRVLKPWDEVKNDPPKDGTAMIPYPFPDARMTRLYLHPELIRIGQRFLKTDDVFVRTGNMLARYPGFVSGDTGHIDNGNNSLLPPSESHREFSQPNFWIHLEGVTADQAPLLLIKNKDKRDLSKAVPLVCPPGTVCAFHKYTWHASSTFKGKEGHRFTWGFGLGRADHIWEGLIHYTALGQTPAFQQAVCQMSVRERCLFKFPKPNHPYYTKQTLDALEAQYPGFNASGKYKSMNAD